MGTVSFCRGCESVRGHYLPSLIHAISCSLGSKNGNAPHNVPTVVRCCPTWHSAHLQKIPWARGPAQIILINCGTEQPQLPQRHQDSNIHIPTHQHKRPKCISIHKEHAKTLILHQTLLYYSPCISCGWSVLVMWREIWFLMQTTFI